MQLIHVIRISKKITLSYYTTFIRKLQYNFNLYYRSVTK